MARRLQSIPLTGPSGPIEALLEDPEEPERIRQAVALCHPHPLYGGTMHNMVLYRLARAARKAGACVMRFNFRGIGASAGSYDGGRGEQDDLRAVLRYMKDRYSGLPLTAGGFSFGAVVAARVSCLDPDVERVLAVGLPANNLATSLLSHCGCPKHLIHSTCDEHGTRANLERLYAAASEPKKLTWIEAQDHFFSDALDELETVAGAALR